MDEGHKNFISIVPNPNNGNFELNITEDYFRKESSIVITNVNGIRFFEGVTPENKTKMKLNLNLRPGVYYLKAIDRVGNQLTNSFVVY